MIRPLICLLVVFQSISAQASIFGEESIPLWKLVAGQVAELERLAQVVGVAKEQRDVLVQINQGVEKATRQIEAIESIIERARGLNPTSVKDLADITYRVEELRGVLADTAEILNLKILLCDRAIAQTALQSDTAYKMGQEMIGVGGSLAAESKDASPGRSEQITATAVSAQMLSDGVQLQTLSQIAQLQAMSLELQKVQLQRELNQEQARHGFFIARMGQRSGKSVPKGAGP